jgi:hypothetical protein
MNKILIPILLIAALGKVTAQQNVTNIRVLQSDTLLIVTYDLAKKADIEAYISLDGGATFNGPLKNVTGAIGKAIVPENNKIFVIDIAKEIGYGDYTNAAIKIVANEETNKIDNSYSSNDYEYFKSLRNGDDKVMLQFLKENDTESYEIFDKGMMRRDVGNGFLISGIMFSTLGLIPLIEGYNNPMLYIFLGIGQAFIITGISIKITGGKLKEKGKNHYENKYFRNQTSSLKLNISPNGIGLSLKF